MILPPLPTPFDDAGRPDWEAWQRVADALAPHVDGMLLFGSTGEAVALDPDERCAGLRALRVEGFFGVGVIEESLAQAIAATEAAADAGAAFVLATPPRYYGGGARADVCARFYRELAAVGPEVWLYHVPQLSRVPLPLATVEALAEHPNVTGIKDSSGELARLAFYDARSLGLRVFTGHAPTLLGALALGAEGGILAAANLAAPGYRALVGAWREQRFTDARALQRGLEPLGRTLGADAVALVKRGLGRLGVDAGVPRPPYPATSEHEAPFLRALDRAVEAGWTVARS